MDGCGSECESSPQGSKSGDLHSIPGKTKLVVIQFPKLLCFFLPQRLRWKRCPWYCREELPCRLHAPRVVQKLHQLLLTEELLSNSGIAWSGSFNKKIEQDLGLAPLQVWSSGETSLDCRHSHAPLLWPPGGMVSSAQTSTPLATSCSTTGSLGKPGPVTPPRTASQARPVFSSAPIGVLKPQLYGEFKRMPSLRHPRARALLSVSAVHMEPRNKYWSKTCSPAILIFSIYLLYVLALQNKTGCLRGLSHSQECQCNYCAQEKTLPWLGSLTKASRGRGGSWGWGQSIQ